jgi:hypothetical protein
MSTNVTPGERGVGGGSGPQTVILSERGVGRGSGVEAKDLALAILDNARARPGVSEFSVPSSMFR